VVPLVMGMVTDLSAVRWAFTVPMVAFIYLVCLALGSLRGQSSLGIPR
jgi:fucose permease